MSAASEASATILRAPPARMENCALSRSRDGGKGARDVTLTRNDLFTAFNSREQFILALVEIDGDKASKPRYVQGFAF